MKKATLLTLLLAGISTLAVSQTTTPAARLVQQLHNPASRAVMVAAHRGDWRNAPENSLQAFSNAIAMGVDIIELDLAKTKDGVIVIMHDATIDRTTNGKGEPGAYTLAELKQFRLRNGLGRLTAHTIPTLEEVMLMARGKALINLDKSYPYFREAYAVLQRTQTLPQAVFKAAVTESELRQTYPDIADSITFMAVVDLDKPGARQVIDAYQRKAAPVAFELLFSTDTAAVLYHNAAIRSKAKIWINALWPSLNAGHDDDKAVDEGNTTDSWDWLIAHGATIIQTDRPAQLLAYLKKKGLH